MAQPEMAAPSSAMHMMPDGTQMAAPQGGMPMAVPGQSLPEQGGAPMPGMVDGGYLGFAGDDKNPDMDEDRRDARMAKITRHYLNEDHERPGFKFGGKMNIPGFHDGGTGSFHNAAEHPDGDFSTPHGGSGGIDGGTGTRNSPGDIISIKAAYAAKGYELTDAQANDVLDAERASRDEERAYNSSGAGAGPDHFYEKLAYDAAEAEKERRDARQTANVGQQSLQQDAMMQYRKDIINADTDRKTLANSAVGQAQDTYAKLLSQADPNQGAIYRQPNQGVEYVMGQKGPTYEAPNIPGTVFPENWG